MVELVVRLVFSLAVVVGMLLLLARFSARRLRGPADALVRVVQRQSLSRGTSVAVVTVGSRVLVLGSTEQQVQLLAELDPEELELGAFGVDDDAATLEAGNLRARDQAAPEPVSIASAPSARAAGKHARVADGALAGSLLSTQTWRQAFSAASGRLRDAS